MPASLSSVPRPAPAQRGGLLLACAATLGACGAPVITGEGSSSGMYSPCGADDPACSSTVTQTESGLGSTGGAAIDLAEVASSVSTMLYTDASGCEYQFVGAGVAVDGTWCPDCDLTLLTDYDLVDDTCGYGSLAFKAALGVRVADDGLRLTLGYANYSYYYGGYDDYGYYGAPPPAYSYWELGAGTGALSGNALTYALTREYVDYYYEYYGYGDGASRVYTFDGTATLY